MFVTLNGQVEGGINDRKVKVIKMFTRRRTEIVPKWCGGR